MFGTKKWDRERELEYSTWMYSGILGNKTMEDKLVHISIMINHINHLVKLILFQPTYVLDT